MRSIYAYLMGICTVAVLISVIQSFVPSTQIKRILHFSGGLLLMIVVISPVVALDSDDLQSIFTTGFPDKELSIEEIQRSQSELMEQLISERFKEYILDKVNLPLSDIEINTDLDEDGDFSSVTGIHITGSFTVSERKAIQGILENDFGIPASCQEWISE